MFDSELLKLIGVIVGTALTTWGGAWAIARRSRESIELKIHDVEDGIRKWQAQTIEGLRKALKESEDERIIDGRNCDKRIDELRGRYDALQDKYDALAVQHSDYRIQVHDLRNVLNKYVGTELPGGRRFYDPVKLP